MRRLGLVVCAILLVTVAGLAPPRAGAADHDRARGSGGFGPVRFAFTATARAPTGTHATGRFRRSWTVLGAPPGAVLTGRVSCLVVDGDRATFGGVLDVGSLHPSGFGAFAMTVRDADGDGGADEASWGVLLSPADLPRACAQHDRLTRPLWSGRVVVRDSSRRRGAAPERERAVCWNEPRGGRARAGCVPAESGP